MVTYKWLARRFSVPFDTSKRILFEFLTRHPQVPARQPLRPCFVPAMVAPHPPTAACAGPAAPTFSCPPAARLPACLLDLQKVKATFMLSGWAPPSDGGGEGQQAAHHIVRIVDGQQVCLGAALLIGCLHRHSHAT